MPACRRSGLNALKWFAYMYIFPFAAGKWFQKSSSEKEQQQVDEAPGPVPEASVVQTVQVNVHRSEEEEETPREGRYNLNVLF